MKEVPSPETMSHEQYIWEKLLPDVRENGTGPKCHVGLRDAMYARSRDSKIAYVMNQQHPQVDLSLIHIFLRRGRAERSPTPALSAKIRRNRNGTALRLRNNSP